MLLIEKYKETIHELFQRKPGKNSKDCSIMRAILPCYDNPQDAYPIVHIAGTNGKGQVAAKMAFALQNAGYKVGLFISPHLYEYEERITINGQKISKEKVMQYHRELDELLTSLSARPHFFECTTTYAFRYFKEEQVDIAIVETGLGGKCDSTNVILPILSVITSVSYDHIEYLGSTLEDIAEQKAGIIKQNVPVVVGSRAKYLPIFRKAEELSAPIHIIEKKSCFYDTENQMIANEALSILRGRFHLEDKHIQAGLKISLPCRFEKKGNIIYDVAHNPDGFSRLSNALEYHYPFRKFRFVIGLSRGKDVKGCLQKIEKNAHFVHFVQAQKENTYTPNEFAEVFQKISTCPFSVEESVLEGFQKAKALTNKKDILVVCGSFFIMSETISPISRPKPGGHE